MAEIKVTSRELHTKSEQLAKLNQQFHKAVEEMTSYEQKLMGMWDGEAKEQFHKAYTSDAKQMEEFFRTIEKYCQTLKQDAVEYEKAEKRNLQTASKRSYR